MNTNNSLSSEANEKSGIGWEVSTILIGMLIVMTNGTSALGQDTALVIGNSNYSCGTCDGGANDCNVCANDAQCPGGFCAFYPPLPGVQVDVDAKQNALQNAGWAVVIKQDRTRQQMIDDIANTKPPEDKKYIVWYAGHGDVDCPPGAAEGQWVGTDCNNLTPADYVAALGGNADRTLTILDSCGGGAFAAAVNAINPAIGFITSTTGLQCAGKGAGGGFFSQCFIVGLNGAADANGDGDVTVQEAWDYANANCHFAGQDPTWDGDYAGYVIGQPKPIPTLSDWGAIGMTLLLLTGGTIVFFRKRGPEAAA